MPRKRFQTTTELAAALDRLDDHGKLIPIKRAVGLPLAAAAALASDRAVRRLLVVHAARSGRPARSGVRRDRRLRQYDR